VALRLLLWPAGINVGIMFWHTKDYQTVKLTKTVTAEQVGKSRKRWAWRVRGRLHATRSLVLTYWPLGQHLVTTSLMSWLPTYCSGPMTCP
jgi:hypothetical protein